mmetsp:Transcript_9723/g.32261  ORF Transcript_9723/g.32261 Transcript_9723/m.32261 type:complete len:211 (-) Transcript_9723:28-660(-)
MLLEQGEDGWPARDERLLVREGDGAAELDRLDRWQQPRAPHHARHDGVCARCGRDCSLPLGPCHYLGHCSAESADPIAQLLLLGGVRETDDLGTELGDLLREEIDVGAGRERDHLKVVGILARDVQRLRADRSCRAEQRHVLALQPAVERPREAVAKVVGREHRRRRVKGPYHPRGPGPHGAGGPRRAYRDRDRDGGEQHVCWTGGREQA